MTKFILKKLLYGLLVIPGIATLVFFLLFLLPSPETQTIGQRSNIATKDAIRKELGLDKSMGTRYLDYMNKLTPIGTIKPSFAIQNSINYAVIFKVGADKVFALKIPYLGKSYQSREKVSTIIIDALPGTVILAFSTIIIAMLLGIPFGIFAALYKDKFIDKFLITITTFGISLPSFFLAIIIAWIFGYVLHQYTGLNMNGYIFEPNPLGDGYEFKPQNLILPAIALGIRPLSVFTQLTRSTMLDVLQKDYIRTAYSKGLTQTQVIWRHGIKNAMNPIVTSVSGWFASLLAGAFFTEYIFNWKGLGKVTIEAMQNSDLPLIAATILFIALVFVLVQVLVDIVYVILDPRTRTWKKA